MCFEIKGGGPLKRSASHTWLPDGIGIMLALLTVVVFACGPIGTGQTAFAAAVKCGGRKPSITQRDYHDNRPADFYELCIGDGAVCSDLERRLIIAQRNLVDLSDDINSFYLGFEVPVEGWKSTYNSPQEVPPNLPKGYGWLRTLSPRLALDLNGDGKDEVLYRIHSSLGGRESVLV